MMRTDRKTDRQTNTRDDNNPEEAEGWKETHKNKTFLNMRHWDVHEIDFMHDQSQENIVSITI